MSWQGYADFIVEKGKGLFSHENKPFCVPFGGDKRDRTADLLNAIQALSQLSYTPISTCACRTGRPNELYFSRVGRVCQLFFSLFYGGCFRQANFSEKGDTHGENFMV